MLRKNLPKALLVPILLISSSVFANDMVCTIIGEHSGLEQQSFRAGETAVVSIALPKNLANRDTKVEGQLSISNPKVPGLLKGVKELSNIAIPSLATKIKLTYGGGQNVSGSFAIPKFIKSGNLTVNIKASAPTVSRHICSMTIQVVK